jgi:16S rRNA (adenine1518-N6/adenine1519-N6)-dimethyltransferase
MSAPALPPLREVIAKHGLSASKALGQNFLFDEQLLERIAAIPGSFKGEQVYEVGPGPGGLTRALLESDAARVVLVEKDPRFLPLLAELDDGTGRLVAVEADALKVREAELVEGPAHVVSNLPYNVGTPLLIKWLTGPWTPHALTLMFQKEVAERIVAAPGDDAYGRLAVIAQAVCEPRLVMHRPAAAFTPPPKVMSAIIHVEPKAMPEGVSPRMLERVTEAAFGQRRKMLRQSLKGLPGALDALEALGIDPQRRAETLDVADFVAIARVLTA